MDSLSRRQLLNAYYREVSDVIVHKQNPISGLLPASTAVSVHGDYTDAWVRDNVYSILAVWGLSLAYRALDDDDGRGKELEGRTIHLMRGLLRSMMAQAHKVEAFKLSRHPRDALHAKYDTRTGGQVVGDDAWGHLQIDATSLYLLMLAQMISSGLHIIWTDDEVSFVQNLVYYIERAYRTADFGIWERGAKSNHGRVELNASSLGMAKAALEALSEFNLFGARGGRSSVLHVSPDNIAQADITLCALLPRESNSKEVDAAVLSILGYPAFAVHDAQLVDKARSEIKTKLEGRYGLKRFLRDGHQTLLEDHGRLHYEAEELKQFEHIESEWPLFFTYLYLDALFRHDSAEVDFYAAKLDSLLVERAGQRLLPELYYVPLASIAAERLEPGSTDRVPNDNVPLVWAQSLYLLGRMIQDQLLSPGDIDPLGRRRHKQAARPVVQILLLAEDEALQAELAAHGVRTETLQDIAPVQVYLPDDIALAHAEVGRCERLGISGRAARALKSLTTSRIYQIDGQTVICLAPFFLQREFYLAYDMGYLVSRLRGELSYLWRHWVQSGRPTVSLLLTRSLLATDRTALFELILEIQMGKVGEVPVRQGMLRELLTTASFERLDHVMGQPLPRYPVAHWLGEQLSLPAKECSFPLSWEQEHKISSLSDVGALVQQLSASDNLYERIEILDVLVGQSGLQTRVEVGSSQLSTLEELCEEVYDAAGRARLWQVVRHAAGLLKKVDVDLNLACAALLVAHKQIQVGRSYSSESLIVEPVPDQELLDRIERFCREDVRDRVLTQELLLHLGVLVRGRPGLFRHLPTIRVSHIIGLLTGDLARQRNLPVDRAYDAIMELPPLDLKARLVGVLERYDELETLPQQLERLGVEGETKTVSWSQDAELTELQEPKDGWHSWRQFRGVVDRRSADFYARTFSLFHHVPCLVIGDKLDRRNRIESRLVLSDMTPGEQTFANLIDHYLNKAPSPEYRQLTLETLAVLSSFFQQNASLQLTDTLYVDAMIGHGVRWFYLERFPQRRDHYDNHKAEAWSLFYSAAPYEVARALVQGLQHLLFTREDELDMSSQSSDQVAGGQRLTPLSA